MTAGALVSIGYEGRSLAELVEALQAQAVTTLVDVRLNPISRKKGFSKGPLRMAIEAGGIRYVHEPALGNPPGERAGFHAKDPAEARDRFRERIATTGTEAIGRLAQLARAERVAVLCVERDESRCHRQVVIEAVTAITLELGVVLAI